MLYVLVVALAAIASIGMVINVVRKDELDEQYEMLKDMKASLDERANLLASWQEELSQENGWYRFDAVYTVTASDGIRYKSEKTLMSAARKHLATTIAGDIVHRFPPLVEIGDDGRAKKFSYSFTVRQSWQQGQPSSQTTSANAIAESPAK